jgi:SAM-dependent methyltransferase
MTGSLAYRKNEEAIRRGEGPDKYTRLLPYIPGNRILELGSAEGVLALMLADAGKGVVAVEKSIDRFEQAIILKRAWIALGKDVAHSFFFCGDIAERLDFFEIEHFDTLVAVRMIYYLGDNLNRVFAKAAKHIPNVVLCGNKNRAARYEAGNPDEPLGLMNYYASARGMAALLERHGYTITQTVEEGDPVVVGRMV